MTIGLLVGIVADGRLLAFGRPFSRVLETVAFPGRFDDVAVVRYRLVSPRGDVKIDTSLGKKRAEQKQAKDTKLRYTPQ